MAAFRRFFVAEKKTFPEAQPPELVPETGAKIARSDGSTVTLFTANGQTSGSLTRADRVRLGKLQAQNIPLVVQKTDDRSYGPGVDGLLGMSFLSRFEMKLADGFIEIRTRRPK